MIIGAAVAVAGSLGATTRFTLDAELRSRAPNAAPWATASINVTGSLLLGVLVGLVMFHGAPGDLATVAGTGFCGGYTTFSTASFETVRLGQQRRYVAALLSSLGTLALTLAAGGLALWLTSR